MIEKILFITLSNIGDAILTLPALDALKENFPQAKITVMTGPRPKEIFQNNPGIDRVIIFDKHAALREKINLFKSLKKEKFGLIIDLRNSIYGALLPAKYKTSPFLYLPKKLKHMKERHLYRVHSAQCTAHSAQCTAHNAISLHIRPEDEEYIRNILKGHNISGQDEIIVVSPGARSHIKRWDKDKFVDLINGINKDSGAKIILAGDKDDAETAEYIAAKVRRPLLNLAGKTSIAQLACLLRKARLLITNDSATMHLASYLNIPTVAIFGPTSELKYGPWSEKYAVVKKEVFCRPCEKAQCRFGTLECMQLIKMEDVLRAVRKILAYSLQLPPKRMAGTPIFMAGTAYSLEYNFKRILIVRTDKMGDVLLATPVIKAVRLAYPCAYIAMMVCPYTKELVEGNPYLDQVIIYDKDNKHKSWGRSMRFALNLKKKKFDLAIILHPTNRVHLVTFFARVTRRVGYDRKLGFLLTDKIRHTKQFGEKHELEYNLDLVRYLGIPAEDKEIFMPIKPESEKWAEELFRQKGITSQDKLLGIHPSASCPSRLWPYERFAEAADRLSAKFGFKVLIIAGPRDIEKAKFVSEKMHVYNIDLSAQTSISQLASLIRRCSLFISNDSGPVHIASGVGTPVISIFGRNQKGLSPKRWAPVGKKDRYLHRDVGCIECLAHNCKKSFTCLKSISVEDVLKVADEILTE